MRKRAVESFFKLRVLLIFALIAGPLFATGRVVAQVPLSNAESDLVTHATLDFQSVDPDGALLNVANTIKDVFDRFQFAVDAGMQIITPLQVWGAPNRPNVQVTIKKCVLVICKTVTINGAVSVQPSRGSCAYNFDIAVDLSQSSSFLSDQYDKLSFGVCYSRTAANTGHLDLIAQAERAPKSQPGIFRNQIFSVLKLQTAPVIAALKATLSIPIVSEPSRTE